MSLSILRNNENAIATYLSTVVTGSALTASVTTGFNNIDKIAPIVIVYSSNSTEDFPYSGIYHVDTQIIVKEMASDINVNTTQLAYTIYNNLLSGSAIPAINTYGGYYCYNILVKDHREDIVEDAHIHTLSIDSMCALQ